MNIEGWALLSLLATYLGVSVLLIVVPIIVLKRCCLVSIYRMMLLMIPKQPQ